MTLKPIHPSKIIRTEKPSLSPRQRSLRTLLKRQIGNRITRIPHIHLLARLIIIRQLPQIDQNLIIRRAAIVQADVIHGGVDVVHAGIIRRPRGATVVLREPEAHDALGARVGPIPGADRGVGGVDGGARVVDDGQAVVPSDVEAGAVVEEKGAVNGGGGDEVDGAVAGVVGEVGALNDGATWVTTVCEGEDRGEEKEDKES